MLNTLIAQIQTMAEDAVRTLPSLAIALVVLVITAITARFATRIAAGMIGKTALRPSLRNLIETLTKLGVWLLGVFIAAVVVFPGVSAGSLIAGLGVGAVAIGFAFQDIFENFLAGVFIMLRDKMRIDDTIEIDGILGKVEHITLRETHIRQFSGELTILPNAQIFKNPVQIWTDLPERRFEVVVGVAYDSDLDHAADVIETAVKSVDLISDEKPVQVLADNFGGSSVDFLVRWWAASSGSDAVMNRDQVIRAIKRGLDEAGIEIPFPYITHTFKERVPVIDALDKAA